MTLLLYLILMCVWSIRSLCLTQTFSVFTEVMLRIYVNKILELYSNLEGLRYAIEGLTLSFFSVFFQARSYVDGTICVHMLIEQFAQNAKPHVLREIFRNFVPVRDYESRVFQDF